MLSGILILYKGSINPRLPCQSDPASDETGTVYKRVFKKKESRTDRGRPFRKD